MAYRSAGLYLTLRDCAYGAMRWAPSNSARVTTVGLGTATDRHTPTAVRNHRGRPNAILSHKHSRLRFVVTRGQLCFRKHAETGSDDLELLFAKLRPVGVCVVLVEQARSRQLRGDKVHAQGRLAHGPQTRAVKSVPGDTTAAAQSHKVHGKKTQAAPHVRQFVHLVQHLERFRVVVDGPA